AGGRALASLSPDDCARSGVGAGFAAEGAAGPAALLAVGSGGGGGGAPGAEIVIRVFGVVPVGDQAVDQLVAIDGAERRFRRIGHRAEIGERLVAAFLEVFLVLALAQIVILR